MQKPTQPEGAPRFGLCADCNRHHEATVAVCHIEQGSGPGYIQRACLHHARERATSPDAPAWLHDSLRALGEASQ